MTISPVRGKPEAAAAAADVPARRTSVQTTLGEPGLARHTVPAAGASVMGTGIVGIAAHTLPVHFAGQRILADASWLLAAALLAGVLALNAVQILRHPHVAKAHLLDRRTAPATGTMAMAFLTVGTATLLIGTPWLGALTARTIDSVVYSIGTLVGLATTVGVPLLLITRKEHGGPTDAAATWLLPVVPPMVSAAAGGILAQRLAAGNGRSSLVVVSLLLFGMSLFAAFLMISVVWARLLLHGMEATAATPSLWVVLGPLGQGATALSAIAIAAKGTLPAPYPNGLAIVALVGGTALLGFAALWAILSSTLTIRSARDKMAFHLGWWSFTFPIGTCVTGLSALATRMDLPFLTYLAAGAFICLVFAWLTVALGTAQALRHGTLISPLAGQGP